jgi:sugar-specific transcriptional regulator TrmB
MKQLINLTEMEKQVLNALIDGLYAEAGFSDVDADDLSKATEIPTKSIRGVLGSLSKKGIIFTDEINNGEYVIVYLHESHYGLVPRWAIEENIEAIEIA